MKSAGFIVFAFFAIVIGLYPASYLLVDMSGGFFSSKTTALLSDPFWKTAFYLHISFGGLALLTGWSQFHRALRSKYLSLHRTLGKIYVTAVTVSGVAGLYIAYFATGGRIASLGFTCLAASWLTCSFIAFMHVRKGEIDLHQQWMIRSYALTFAAVTLRLWIPFFQLVLHMEFVPAYRIIAWLCWVPNLFVAEWLARKVART